VVVAWAVVFPVALRVLARLGLGFVPGLRATRGAPARTLVAGARATAHRSRLQGALTVVQLGASLTLLAAGGLFVRSLQNVRSIDVGFDMPHLVAASIPMQPGAIDDEADRAAVLDRAAALVRRVPGVRGATAAAFVPFRGAMFRSLEIPGRETPAGRAGPMAMANVVDTAYFRVMGIPLVRGRGFDAADRAGAPEVVVVSAGFARRYWPGEDALGKCVRLGTGPGMPCAPVVGVAGDVKTTGLQGEADPLLYTALAQADVGSRSFAKVIARVSGPAAEHAGAVRTAFQSADPRLPFVTAAPVAEAVAQQLAPWQLGAAAFSVFGALALVIASVGLYGVVSYLVAQRTTEFGIRLALGARPADVVRAVVRHGAQLAGVGLVLGLAGGAAVARLLAAKLYGVSPYEPATYLAVSALLGAVALAASYLPARRAARVDPMVSLRSD
jgi:putative ABC transport system permease protein